MALPQDEQESKMIDSGYYFVDEFDTKLSFSDILVWQSLTNELYSNRRYWLWWRTRRKSDEEAIFKCYSRRLRSSLRQFVREVCNGESSWSRYQQLLNRIDSILYYRSKIAKYEKEDQEYEILEAYDYTGMHIRYGRVRLYVKKIGCTSSGSATIQEIRSTK